LVVRDNVPVVAAVLVPSASFVLAGAGVFTLAAAFRISIVFSLAALVWLGFREGRAAGLGWSRSVVSGLAAGGIGVLMVFVEAAFE